MAIEWDLRFRDMLYGIGGRPHDHRIEVGGWTYYVLPRLWKCDVRFESQVQDEVPSIDSAVDWLALWLLRGLGLLLRKPWQVRVWRKGSVATWNDQAFRCVYVEKVPHAHDPEPRVLELIAEIAAGRFRPTT